MLCCLKVSHKKILVDLSVCAGFPRYTWFTGTALGHGLTDPSRGCLRRGEMTLDTILSSMCCLADRVVSALAFHA